jgi:uncharacterized protein (TIGR02118 family)
VFKFIALYKQPTDKAAFDQHFNEVHTPLCLKVPNLLKLEVTRITGTPRGGESEYYVMAEMYFKDQATMMESLMTEAGMATGKDVRGFAKDIFTGLFAEATETGSVGASHGD